MAGGQGGAVGRVGEAETALGKRDARRAFQVLWLWPDPSGNEAHRASTRAIHVARSTYTEDVSFPTFSAEANSGKVADAYASETWARRLRRASARELGGTAKY